MGARRGHIGGIGEENKGGPASAAKGFEQSSGTYGNGCSQELSPEGFRSFEDSSKAFKKIPGQNYLEKILFSQPLGRYRPPCVNP